MSQIIRGVPCEFSHTNFHVSLALGKQTLLTKRLLLMQPSKCTPFMKCNCNNGFPIHMESPFRFSLFCVRLFFCCLFCFVFRLIFIFINVLLCTGIWTFHYLQRCYIKATATATTLTLLQLRMKILQFVAWNVKSVTPFIHELNC